MTSLNIIGLMSGTSMDAVDAALVAVSGSGASLAVKLLAFHSASIPGSLRERILRACDPATGDTRLLCELNVEIGEAFAAAALALLDAAGLRPGDVDLIGSHGQTIYHQGAPGAGSVASTLQLGEPSVIAERTGITTIADFRPRDMAAGGQGAPLVSYVDWALCRSATAGRALQNIGGIANVTVLPAGAGPEAVFAFDTGPGNLLIDATARLASGGALLFDQDGRMARTGRADPALLKSILDHPFLQLLPPRTAGREQFGEHFARRVWERGCAAGLRPEDIVATCTVATARSIADAYRRWVLPRVPLEAIYLSGGGARNPALLDGLRAELSELPLRQADELGVDARAKEALAFAVLAAETLRGVPTSLPGATGARHASVLGKLVPGANWGRLLAIVREGGTERLRDRENERGTKGESIQASLRPSVHPSLHLVIGLDGGGSKTEAVALDESGAVVARAAGGPANPAALGREAAGAALGGTLAALVAALSDDATVVALHAALAGVGRPEDEPPIRALLLERCARPPLEARLGRLTAEQVGVSNDALAVLAAAGAAEEGIVVIAGTGSLVWGRNRAGATTRCGGWGYLLGDEGSGYDLGRRSLTAVLAAHDGRAPATALSAAVLAHFGLQAPPELVRRIYGSARAREEIATLAPLTFAAAAAGDVVASGLIGQTVRDLADQVAVVARRLALGPAPFTVVCSGGLFRQRALLPALQEALAGCAGAVCRPPERSPAEGAALLAAARVRR